MAAEELYLDLLKRVLTRDLAMDDDPLRPVRGSPKAWQRGIIDPVQRLLGRRGYVIASRRVATPGQITAREARRSGRIWPVHAETMIGFDRLDNIATLIRTIICDDVPGDLMECGVWRGGAAIYIRAALTAYGDADRVVWLADSFAGLPPPDAERYPADAGLDFSMFDELAVGLDEVKANFERYGYLDDRTRFVKGLFRDTLPSAPVEQLSMLRLDGDLYESTWDGLTSMYPKLSTGGFLIVDDYGAIAACRQAVHDYRTREGIGDKIVSIDHTGIFWQRT